jgi:DedD protein
VAAAPEQATVTPAPKAEPKAEPKVEPKPETKPAAKPEPKPAAKPAGTYYVQIGVFVSSASARRLERQLRDKKFAVVVDEITRSGKKMFRVRVGPEIDRAAANALAKKLADAGHKGSVVK